MSHWSSKPEPWGIWRFAAAPEVAVMVPRRSPSARAGKPKRSARMRRTRRFFITYLPSEDSDGDGAIPERKALAGDSSTAQGHEERGGVDDRSAGTHEAAEGHEEIACPAGR